MTKFFTYGTLKKNESRHYILQELGAQFVKKIALPNRDFLLLDLKVFPALVEVARSPDGTGVCPAIGNNPTKIPKYIYGELYELPEGAFKVLDEIEGHPDFYKRETFNVKGSTDLTEVTLYYVPWKNQLPNSIKAFMHGAESLLSGKWKGKKHG